MADELKAESLDLSSLRIPRDEGPRRGRRGVLVFSAAIAMLGAAGIVWVLLRGGTRAAVVQTDFVRLVGAGATSAVLSAGGYILPDRKADVSSKVYGRLEWIGVDAGSKVKAGDVLARLANAGEAGRVDEAKAALAEAERELDRMKRLVEAGVETR
ncbi:MAG TPA: biotin/lipoyl-binding protein, partial [Planctomycetota bacterium]